MYIQSVIHNHEQSLLEFDTLKQRKKGNAIINSVSRLCSWPTHSDRFSLKFAFSGTEYYCLNKNRIPVRDNQFLVVNEEQAYSSFIRSPDWVNSFSIYIDAPFFNQVVSAYTTTEEILLDNPNYQHDQVIWFFDQLYTASAAFSQPVRALKMALESNLLLPAEEEAYLHQILALLLKTYQTKRTQHARSLACVKASTRLELYRRLHLAKEFIDDQAADSLHLEDIARTAMLSKNHLLRHFKALFGYSPHQHLINRRMERARHRLLDSDLPVHQIAQEQGFACPSAFGRRFKSLFLLSPADYRQRFTEKVIFA